MANDETSEFRFPRGVVVSADELTFEFSRGGGPGGQNVNKVSSRVTLRFDVAGSPSLTDSARAILLDKLKTRLTNEGVLVLHASEYRDQPRNREAAIGRFVNLVTEALTPVKARRKTRPTRGSVERRIAAGKRRSDLKKKRRPPRQDD